MLRTFDTGKNIKGDMRGMKKVPIPATLLAHVYHMCQQLGPNEYDFYWQAHQVPILLTLFKTSIRTHPQRLIFTFYFSIYQSMRQYEQILNNLKFLRDSKNQPLLC